MRRPSTACRIFSNKIITSLFKHLAFVSIWPSFSFQAVSMELVILVEKTQVRVKHHLPIFLLLRRLIYELPLIFVGITVYGPSGSPTFYYNIFEVIVVEYTLAFGISPPTIIARVFRLCTSNSVCTRNGSYQIPSMELILFLVENIFSEHLWKVFTASFWIWHVPNIIGTFQ